MTATKQPPPEPGRTRRRATSKRALVTAANLLDAAERLFAERGYDGASIRDIASAAGAQIASVSFHHGGKETLFERVVERRASELAELRVAALENAREAGNRLTLEAVLAAFVRPYLEKAANDEQWLAYARLVAMVSADRRWRHISKRLFDPTAGVFIDEIAALFPQANRGTIAISFVFSVSAMLSVSTSRWRIEELAEAAPDHFTQIDALADPLIRYCASGIRAAVAA
ncbi:TetR/AcrR family transcriptional regulator [Hoeflea sp.]|uniref:TetR/AcrR family transcriptional regulator n=1 Tax=Hoeflea sp. TaxID=1940281 RepID=UPI003B528FAA